MCPHLPHASNQNAKLKLTALFSTAGPSAFFIPQNTRFPHSLTDIRGKNGQFLSFFTLKASKSKQFTTKFCSHKKIY